MAVNAAGYLMGAFLPQLTSDHLKMDLLDLSVALHACICDVVAMDGRCPVLVWKDVVRVVAARADGRDDQSTSE